MALHQNYPNPFNPKTTIEFTMENKAHVELHVYDVLGRHVKTLVDENRSAGNYRVNFVGSDLPSGNYLYRLTIGNNMMTKQMLILK